MPASADDDVLDLVPYFAGLRPDEKARVATRLRVVDLVDAERAELEADALAVVVGGEATLARGQAEPIRLVAGDTFGEVEVVRGGHEPATLVARGPARVATLARRDLDALFAEIPSLALPFVVELGRELKWHNDLLREVCMARSEGLSAAELAEVVRRRRRRLLRHRRFSSRRLGAALWRALVTEPARRPAFAVFVGAIVALVGARTVVALILREGLQKHLFALIGGQVGHPIHVHHFNYGLVTVSLVGLLTMLPGARRQLRALAFAFGFGVGLVVDEFALLWNLNPDYYQPSSRVAAAVVLFGLAQIVYFGRAWTNVARRLLSWARA